MKFAAKLFFVVLVVGCDAVVDPPPENAPPIARLLVPQLWPAGEPALIDPTLSSDPDDDALTFSVTFGDGTQGASGDGVFEHVYGAPSSYAVDVIVSDGELEAGVQSRIVVVLDEVEPCSCAAPCLEDGVCVTGTCMLLASSAVDEPRLILEGEMACDSG